MTLNHSKTWPVTTMAVVQLRVNPQEIIENGQREDEAQPKQFEKLFNENEARNNELVVPLLEKHLEIFAKMSSAPNLKATIRTDTVSTILDPADFDSERNEICEEPPLKSPTLLRGDSVQKFHVLALTRIEETSVGVDVDDESGGGVDGNPRHSGLHMYGRRPSIKVDNWDFIYTERGPEVQIPCPIHRYPLNSPNGRLDSNGLKDSLLPPDLPIDARKAATLRRHYYPEGGWGWVVATCAILVHLLNHGVQLAYSQLVLPGAEKFRVEKVHFADEGPKTTMSSLSRAQSWPLLSGAVPVEDARNIATKTQIQARRFVCRHYYPEGGWGWVVTACAVLVHVINHGIQLSCSQLVAPASFKFHVNPVYPAGRSGLFIGMQNTTDEEFSSDGRPRRSGLSRSRSLPQLSHHDSGLGSFYGGSGADDVPVSRAARLVADLRQLLTLKQHYYPEGGWGWVVLVCAMFVQILGQGMLTSVGLFYLEILKKFGMHEKGSAGWLGAMSTGVALLISPVTIAFCRRKSTRVTAVMGGLITALGCLFTSFATQFHQLFFSYGTVVGIGVGITRDCSTLMVAQYFKRRREFVEIFIVSGSGLGIASMSLIVRSTIGALGWRLGLQVVTGAISVTFILGTFYRSASLYHPQRRAILHIKNQKRKIKDKNKVEDKVPFFDFSTLKSKTVRILLISTGISAFGINTPLFYLAYQAEVEGLGDSTIFLQVYLGLAWTVGCVVFSTLVLHNSTECRIARQYLCQTAVFMCGLSILAFTVVSGNYHAYVMFAWIYGIFCGGYHYSLKMYTYERVRARNFARTWGFVQCSQAIPIVIGVPFSGYMNEKCGDRAGYYFSSTCVLVGSLTLFLIDLHRRKIARHKHTRENGTRHLCVSETCPQRRKLSFSQEPDNNDGGVTMGAAAAALVLGTDIGVNQSGGLLDNIVMSNEKPELTCISEEGIADMDLPDNLLDDLDYIGDCITSCNKVENYLMLSEFENNLIAEMPVILDRKGRRWSLARSKPTQTNDDTNNDEENGVNKGKWKVFPNRVITVIDESSV